MRYQYLKLAIDTILNNITKKYTTNEKDPN